MRAFLKGYSLYLISFIVVLGVVSFSSFYIVNNEKKMALQLLEKDGKAMLDIIERATLKSIEAVKNLEALVADELLSGARLIDKIEKPSRSLLAEISLLNEWRGVDIVDQRGRILVSSTGRRVLSFSVDSILDVLDGKADHVAFHLEENIVVLALKRERGGAIIVYADISPLEALKRGLGISAIIDELLREPRITYAALQNESGIIFATRNVQSLEKISEDTFLLEAIKSHKVRRRLTYFKEERVLELVKPINYSGELVGLLRLGLSLKDWRALISPAIRQVILIHLLILAVFALLFIYTLSRERLRKLQKESQVLFLLFDKMPIGVVITDREGNIILENPALKRMLGGQRFSDFPELVDKLKEAFSTRSFMTKTSVSVDGKRIHLSLNGAPLQTEDFKGLICFVEDITEIVELEEERRRAQELEVLMNTAAGVAHEIRNPLNAIAILLRKLGKEGASPDVLKKIEGSIEKIDAVIKRFISLASPVSLSRKRVSLSDFLSGFLEDEKKLAFEKGINFEYIVKDDGRELLIDTEKIEEAVRNIIRNAFDALGEGGNVRVRAETQSDCVVIEIEDDGPGMSREEVERIFEPYFSKKSSGGGLGLTIALRYVNAHGGKIEVESKRGKGTLFRLRLPYDKDTCS